MFYGLSQSFCSHELYQDKFTDTSIAGKTERKIKKYFDFSAFNWNLNHSNLYSTNGAMNL